METEHNFSVLDLDGEPLVTASRNGFGQMVDSQSESKAKFPLNAITDPAFNPSDAQENGSWHDGHYCTPNPNGGKPLPVYNDRGELIKKKDSASASAKSK